MTVPDIPDHVPTTWVGETGQFLMTSTWEKLRELRDRVGLERIHYVVVPEQVYDMIRVNLDGDDRWLCPDGYWVTVLVHDATWLE